MVAGRHKRDDFLPVRKNGKLAHLVFVKQLCHSRPTLSIE
jgi:hypothetical protein